MKATFTVLAMLVAMSQANAQTIQYDEATNTVVETKAAPAAPVVQQVPAQQFAQVQQAPVPAPTASQSTAITVITPSSAVAAAPVTVAPVQTQSAPTTVIEDQPVKDSREELLKKARGQMEDHTERRVEEKIEEARIRDEKKRADRLNSAIDQSEATPPPALAPVAPIGAAPVFAPVGTEVIVAPAAPVVVPTAQAIVAPVAPVKEVKVERKEVEDVKVESADDVRPVVREEVRSDMARRDERKDDQAQAYVGAIGGIADYPSATNIKANGSAGVQLGYITKNRIVVEGSFAYSSFDIQQNSNGGYYSNQYQYLPYKDLSQYNMTVGLKYEILPGTFRPYVGVLAGYTKRNYSQANAYYTYATGSNQDASSDAIDYGFNVGLDFAVSSNVLIGVDFRYMTNLSNHVDDGYQAARNYSSTYGGTSTTPVEEIDYYSAGISAKFLF